MAIQPPSEQLRGGEGDHSSLPVLRRYEAAFWETKVLVIAFEALLAQGVPEAWAYHRRELTRAMNSINLRAQKETEEVQRLIADQQIEKHPFAAARFKALANAKI